MEFFWRAIVWLLLLAVASAVATAVARSTGRRGRGSTPLFVRTRWLWVGPIVIVGGLMVSAFGFVTVWGASVEGRSELPGATVFIAGLVATFAGSGLLAGRALGHLKAGRTGNRGSSAGARFVRPLGATAAITFVAGHVYLVLYIIGAASGETAALLVGVLYPMGVVVPWVLGFLALRAAGRKRVAWAFLLTAPWPILAMDLLTTAFSRFPGAYVVMAVTAALSVRLAWGLASQTARVQATA